MSNIEEKVDMSLDQLVSMRRKEKTVTKKPKKKRESKATPMKIDKAAVQQTSNKMKRANQVAKRRGLATSVETPTETQKRARKAVKTTTVTLGAGKKKKKTDNSPQIPKTISIQPTQNARPISIKDFVLPKDTKMTISFESVTKQPKKQQQTNAAKNSKVMMIVDHTPNKNNTSSKSRRSRRPAAAAAK